MKNLIITTLLIFTVNGVAQKVPFETLETFSKDINAFQKNANGKVYTDGKQFWEVTFPEVSFNVSFHNQLATKAVYKKNDEKETLELTENIDLSQAIEVKNYSYGGVAGALRIYFPVGSIKTKVYENNELKHTYNETYVEIFYDKSSENDKLICTAKVNELISIFKETHNKPFDSFLLESYYHNMYASNANYKMGSKSKVESQANKLMANNNKYGFYSQGLQLYLDKDYVNAKKYLQRGIELGNYDGYIWLGFMLSDNAERQQLQDKAFSMRGFYAYYMEANKYETKNDYTTAIYYKEKAIQKSHPAYFYRGMAKRELFKLYLKNRKYETVQQLLLDEETFSSGLTEIEILNISYDLLVETGKCNEALALLNQTVNSPNTDAVKRHAYEKLETLYYTGCKGDQGNNVKKSNKLAKEATSKKYSFVIIN